MIIIKFRVELVYDEDLLWRSSRNRRMIHYRPYDDNLTIRQKFELSRFFREVADNEN